MTEVEDYRTKNRIVTIKKGPSFTGTAFLERLAINKHKQQKRKKNCQLQSFSHFQILHYHDTVTLRKVTTGADQQLPYLKIHDSTEIN